MPSRSVTDPLPVPRWLRRVMMALMACSLAFTLFEISVDAAVRATPSGTRDSAGRTMGFNDRFSLEHYGIILGNMSVSRTYNFMRGWDWLLVGAQVLGMRLLLRPRHKKWMMWFCAVQPVAFWPGFFGIPMVVAMPLDVFYFQTTTRESFVDVPSFPYMGAGLWILTCAFMAWRFHRIQVPGRKPEPEETRLARRIA